MTAQSDLSMRDARLGESDRLDELVRARLIRALYSQSRVVLWTTIAVATITAGWGLTTLGDFLVVGWWASVTLWSLGRMFLARRFDGQAHGEGNLGPWARRFVVGSAGAGALWGSAGIMFYEPGSLTSEFLLALVLGGMAAGATTTLMYHLTALYVYLALSLAPLTILMAMEADPTHGAMSLMLSIFAGVLAWTAWRSHDHLARSYRLQFENELLVVELRQAEGQLRDMNRDLDLRVRERTRELREETQLRVEADRTLQRGLREQTVGRLAGGLAHDFNNLLAIVQGNLELALLSDVSTAVRSRVQAATRAADRGTHLVKGLLAFTRREALVPGPTDLSELLTQMLDSFVAGVLPDNIRIERNEEDALWMVEVDPAHCESAIVNLLVNARDAMPGGGAVSIRARNVVVEESRQDGLQLDPGDYVCLGVTDTGSGMSAEVQQRALEPFFTTKASGSSGLGLSIVVDFAAQSGGSVRIESKVGEGTTVELSLRRSQRDAVVAGADVVTSSAPFVGRVVLLVEDYHGVRAVARAMCEILGFRVVEAENASDALERLAEFTPDVLFTDIAMPGEIDGNALTSRMRDLHPGIPVLLTSGHDRAPAVGDGHVLAKPYDLGALRRAFMEVLSASGETAGE